MTGHGFVAVALAIQLAATGCGDLQSQGEQSQSRSNSRETNMNSEDLRPDFVVVGDIPAGQKPDLGHRLSLFRSERMPTDRVPDSPLLRDLEASMVDALVPAHWQPGKLQVGESRLALAEAGSKNGRFFVIPSDRNWVCYLVTEYDIRQCVASLTSEGATVGATEVDRMTVLHGLIEDEVQAVQMWAGSSAIEVSLGKNAFFAEFPRGQQESDIKIELSRKDGSVGRLNFELQGRR